MALIDIGNGHGDPTNRPRYMKMSHIFGLPQETPKMANLATTSTGSANVRDLGWLLKGHETMPKVRYGH